jgi:hypothetical protein
MRARSLAEGSGPPSDSTHAPQVGGGATAAATEAESTGHGRRRRRRPPVDLFNSELMAPEWMVSVPQDLATEWLCVAQSPGLWQHLLFPL